MPEETKKEQEMSVSIKTEKRTIVQEVTVETKYFCDRCGKEIEYDRCHSNKFKEKRGWGSYDGGKLEYVEAFFCDDCSIVIKRLLADNGVILSSHKSEW
jgi:hypothetical protein